MEINADHIKMCVSHPLLFNAIPLTADLLNNIGFKAAWPGAETVFSAPNPSNIKYVRLDVEPNVRIEGSIFYYGDIHCCEIAHFKQIYFVHELQNLHYFNTGEELTIKKESEVINV